ncbi:MAG TPA: bifunctional hydroxymethylpyrimidine kinase/phosphomethylpyrimidine kinase [Gemmatimonadaceae bacterium]|jgi:hydroxymethylpyrimidine/phosphomethylpyrimidine kinase|nr:bifunctional hydroxymethylpyrimidine kinase/phosphomethylpyrimidine kinase [Gemmatimonadaceae bacterium]
MRKVVLTIAGSDSGAGAGIQADLKTFERFGVYGTSAITAITAQNTVRVLQSHPLDATLVRAQIDAVVSDLPPHAVKTGMLATLAIVQTVADALRTHGLRPYVLDPVMVSSSGSALLDPEAVSALKAELLPLADLVTPNLDEAAVLTGEQVRTVADMERAARLLVGRFGARAALVTGGHLAGRETVDVLFTPESGLVQYRHARIDTMHTHGTGCTLSAAIAARLALGDDLPTAVETARAFVRQAIVTAPGLGSGHGPLNHGQQTL